MIGDSSEDCARELTQAGADAIGANCGSIDPAQMAAIVAALTAATNLPVLAQPNAGRPKLAGERTVFEMEPAAFAEGVAECLLAGARLVGGCCGTTARHIRALADVLSKR